MPKVIEAKIDIARTPHQVFDYVCDTARLPEWQTAVEAAKAEPPGIPAVGMRGHEIRRVPGGRRTIRWEVTDCEPGRRWAVSGVDGPVRAHVTMGFVPTGDGVGTHVRYGISFEGHGIGRVIAFLARRGARGDVAENLARLKQRVEQMSGSERMADRG